jgi:hypothetical protein
LAALSTRSPATTALTELHFVASESTFAYFQALKRYLAQHGKPVAFRSDKHSIFRVSNEDAAGGDGMTQFGRANKRLGEVLAWIKEQQDRRPHHRGDLVGPRRSSQKAGLLIALLKAQNHEPDPPAWAAAAAIATSPQRWPRLPQKLPSDILTLQSKGHLNLVATMLRQAQGRPPDIQSEAAAEKDSVPNHTRDARFAERAS